jgi:hypothetical protein
MKLWEVRPGRQVDPDLTFVPGFMVVLRDSFTNLSGGSSNNRIEIGIVIRLAAKYLDPEGPLFKRSGLARQGMLHHVTQHARITAAVFEQRIREQPLQLFADGVQLVLILRYPA